MAFARWLAVGHHILATTTAAIANTRKATPSFTVIILNFDTPCFTSTIILDLQNTD
jgi:hypothetical protein